MFDSTFSVELSSPQPAPARLDRPGLDLYRTGLSFSTQLPGGMNGCSVRYDSEWFGGEWLRRAGVLERGTGFPWRAHAVVRAGLAIAWEGRLTKPVFVGPSVRGFEAGGYGVTATHDDVIAAVDATQVPGRALLLGALARCGGVFTPDKFSRLNLADPGVARAPKDFNGHTPAEAIDILCKGGDGNTRFDFWVGRNQIPHFQPRVAPAEPDYRVDHDRSVQWEVDYEQLYGTILLTYTASAGGAQQTITITNPNFAKTWGGSRTAPVTAGTLSDAGARAFAGAWLSYHAVPIVRCLIHRTGRTGLAPIRGSSERPWWNVQSGQWLQVGRNAPLIIVRTQVDAHAGTLQVEAGEPFLSFDRTVAELASTALAVGRQRSPVTGALLTPVTSAVTPVAV